MGRVVFAANASYGAGGQGEFLRLMASALSGNAEAAVYSRFTPPGGVRAIDLPFTGTARARAFQLVRRVPIVRGRRDWLTLLSDVDFDARLARALADPPALFDGVMAQCCRTMRRLQGGGTRLVVTSLNTHIDHLVRTLKEEHERIGFRGASFVHPRMRRRALREIAAADHVRVNSRLAKRTFVDEGVPPERISVIYPGVDLDHFWPAPKRDDTFRVLAVGSLEPRKGVHYLLEAFETARIPNSELVLIGGTGDRWSKRLLSRFRARYGNIRRRVVDVMSVEAAEIFGPASVLVHAAVEDGYGLIVPQTLACGRPVIVTRATGASELVRDGETGFIVDARSVPQLVEALRALAADRRLWAAMCERCRPSVIDRSYATFAREVRAMYTRVLG